MEERKESEQTMPEYRQSKQSGRPGEYTQSDEQQTENVPRTLAATHQQQPDGNTLANEQVDDSPQQAHAVDHNNRGQAEDVQQRAQGELQQTDEQREMNGPLAAVEEFASEIADPPARGGDEDAEREAGRTTGWVALALAIASLFIWPAVLGPAAVVTGFIAWSQDSRTLGIWSIVLGIISFLVFLFLIPLYA